jgi:hypothetical protein
MRISLPSVIGLWVVVVACQPCRADEGMWLLNNPPRELLRQKYGFEPSPEWLEHLQKSAVRIRASGSLVSPEGLILTNHHVGVDQLQKLSTPERDLLTTGFYARTREEELKCPDLEVQILWSIEDVTARVNAAVKPGQTPAQAYEARRQEMARLESESKKATGLDSEVVTLYHGARYHLYRYQRYDDVRLVMAPEKAVAFFGGDIDNFEYPRYDFDFCFFRIYENGRPLQNEHYLRWNLEGGRDNELMFVVGHPGRTSRLFTVEHLEFLRDVAFPSLLHYLWRDEVKLANFCNEGPEQRRMAQTEYFSVQNSRKARTGGYAGLLDPEIMQAKRKMEAQLRQYAATRPAGEGEQADPWSQIAAAYRNFRTFYPRYRVLREGWPFGSELFRIARTLVRLADELPKPSPERLREYRDSELDSVYLQLYSNAPIYEEFEIERMQSSLSVLAEALGADDPLVKEVFAGKDPQKLAVELVRGCTLKDIETRKKIAAGGREAIAASNDPMIRLAIQLDPEARSLRRRFEDEVEGVERQAYARIAALRFDLFGESTYPDATGTLRLAFGPIRGYEEDGRRIPPFTTIEGIYKRSAERGGVEPFELPQRWLERRERLNLDTPLNFVLTADIIGGNSGSPVVNREGKLSGVIFDGNIHSLVLDFAYDDDPARAVAVDGRAILEALDKIYDAGPLVEEITRSAGQAREGGRPARNEQAAAGETRLFDGKSLDGWKMLTEGVYADHGPVMVRDGALVLSRGHQQTGVVYAGRFPKDNYEVLFEARRVEGDDFFCGMTFPVADEFCTLILGGWGGSVVGLSNVDGNSAVENETTQGKRFENGQWYSIRLRVVPEKIEVWIDDLPYVNLERGQRKFSVWYEQEPCRPFGFSTWETTGELRNIRLRRLP